MSSIEQSFTVRYRYTVHLTEDVFACENPLLAETLQTPHRAARLLVAVDRTVAQAHPALLARLGEYARVYGLDLAGPHLVAAGGEAAKNDPRVLAAVLGAIESAGLCRHSYVLGIGGGAFLDVVGFAAAQAHRGVRLVRLPSTVLAQCDAAVGVKNGVNAFGKKNFLGAFAPPWAVINDLRFLTTLSARDWRAGVAEAIKVSLIKDADFFARLERDADRLAARDLGAMERLILRAAELHLGHIATAGDPFEQGTARPLDFGHWSAHKLEQLSGFRLRHGEAVAIGIALDAVYSHLAGWLSETELARVLALLARLGFARHVPELDRGWARPDAPDCVWSGLREFREHLGGELCVTMLRGIGAGFEVHSLDRARVTRAIARLRDADSIEAPRRATPA